MQHQYFVLNKPCGMVSQFISPDGDKVGLLGELDFSFPKGIHAIGRLDKDSEGLLLLTTDKRITRLLFESKTPHKRTYLVQVRRQVTEAALHQLQTGIEIIIEGGRVYTTPPCNVQVVSKPEALFADPFAYAAQIESSWLRITLTEGKFRQVRKMVAAAGHRCMRLIRVSIEDLHLDGLQPGAIREYTQEQYFSLLHLVDPETKCQAGL